MLKGQKVVHALYGIGQIEQVEEKKILGTIAKYATISFQNDRLKILVNMDQKNELLRELITKKDVPKIYRFLKNCKNILPVKSSDRYNVNLEKLKGADIYKLAEVIKDLAMLSREKKLTPKELSMLKQSKKMMSLEISYVTGKDEEEIESILDTTLKSDS
ncbi:MAG: hypothetical protein M1269_03460 [Chloroflexi bacterium]|nr:hypothetical protein [Chloroflexota bacterium]